MFFDLIKHELANLSLVWFLCDIGKDLFDLYQSNEPGFVTRFLIIVALAIMTVLICKLLLPWMASIALQHTAGLWIHAVGPAKWALGSVLMNGCSWICYLVSRAGRPKT